MRCQLSQFLAAATFPAYRIRLALATFRKLDLPQICALLSSPCENFEYLQVFLEHRPVHRSFGVNGSCPTSPTIRGTQTPSLHSSSIHPSPLPASIQCTF
uniref:(northern house mosquito) hypothetical protein n=1 Tax=Culex pipiens TaxID=7175 RepID=A0A8D8L5G1_CULPI